MSSIEGESVECQPTISTVEIEVSELNTSEIISSQSNAITSSCLICEKITSKKDTAFECKICKGLTHFSCSRLPAYTIYSINFSKRQFICETCAAPTDEFLSLYDKKEEKEAERETLHDSFTEIKRVGTMSVR